MNASVEEGQQAERQKQLTDWRQTFAKLDPSMGLIVLPGERDVFLSFSATFV